MVAYAFSFTALVASFCYLAWTLIRIRRSNKAYERDLRAFDLKQLERWYDWEYGSDHTEPPPPQFERVTG